MSHSLAKKFDKIVAKLGSKNKDLKSNGNEHNDGENKSTDDNNSNEGSNESILQRMKGHLGHGHSSSKSSGDHHVDGAPPFHLIINDLKDSPFKGKNSFFAFLSATTCHSQHTHLFTYKCSILTSSRPHHSNVSSLLF
jgi:hypothetical protein